MLSQRLLEALGVTTDEVDELSAQVSSAIWTTQQIVAALLQLGADAVVDAAFRKCKCAARSVRSLSGGVFWPARTTEIGSAQTT